MSGKKPGIGERTPLAVLMALGLVLPGMLLGGLAALAYFTVINFGWNEGGQWAPDLERFGRVIWLDMMPEVIRGAVAMAVALGLTFLAFKQAEAVEGLREVRRLNAVVPYFDPCRIA